MILQRLNAATARAWFEQCQTTLTVARAANDIDASVEAAGTLALARYGLRVGPPVAPVKRGARMVSRGIGRQRPAGPGLRWQTTGLKVD